MLQPARLEQEFVVADDRGIAGVDVEGIGLARRQDVAFGLAKPIAPLPRQGDLAPEDPETARQQVIRSGEDGVAVAGVIKTERRRVEGRSAHKHSRRHCGRPSLQPPPAALQPLVPDPRGKLFRAHSTEPGNVPCELHIGLSIIPIGPPQARRRLVRALPGERGQE